MATFADRLKTLREQRGETQQDLADLIGVTRNAVSAYEKGTRRPAGESAIEVYYTLADHFNVDLEYLTGQRDSVVRILGSGSDPDTGITVEVTPEELELIRQYRRLDMYNKKIMRMMAHMDDEADDEEVKG